MISRRTLLAALAATPLLGHGRLAAQPAPRVGGAPILLRDDRVWIQVRFGTRGPYTFIIDTGAAINLIRNDLARELGLREGGPIRLIGVGGAQDFVRYQARDVALGTTGIGTLNFGAYRGGDLPIHPAAAGALSASMLTAADSELDFDAGEWRIYPDGRGARPGFTALDSSIRQSDRTPGATPIMVDVQLDGATYRVEVDTGAPTGLALWPGASRRSRLWSDERPFAPGQRRGIGGVGARTRLVRGGELRLGDISFARPLVSLTDPGAPMLRSDGLIGIHLLSQLNLSTDVRAGRLWAKRNARPPAPERYGLGGLWVDEGRGGLVVSQLSPRSPAADAGLRPGDVITGVTLQDWVRRLAGPPGETIDVAYRRGDEAASTRLTLRAFL